MSLLCKNSTNGTQIIKQAIRSISTTSSNLSESELSPVVELPRLGKLQGTAKSTPWTNRKFYQFLGVNYGETTSGPRRFKAPVPVQPWSGVKQATKFGQTPPSLRNLSRFTKEQLMSTDVEDCLNLCVYSNDLGAKKPVIVYVHGGGLFEGGAYQHPGDYYMEKDVVLVVPQYRLGPLGFLSTKTEKIPGNAALLDLILALEWVKENIEHFGGDPNNVTALGQSAGGALVSSMMCSPIVKPDLFNRVILQSGMCVGTWIWDDTPEKKARKIAQFAGVDKKASLEEIEDAFMKMDIMTLNKSFIKLVMTATRSGADFIGGHRLTIGGPSNYLPDTPYNLMRAGKFRKDLDMLIGSVQCEGSFPLSDIFEVGVNQLKFEPMKMMENILQVCGIHDISTNYISYCLKSTFTKEQLERGDFKEMAPGFIDICGNTLIKSSTLRFAQINAETKPDNTFLYTFDHKGQYTRWGYQRDVSKYPWDGGVFHCDDLTYQFPWPTAMSKLNDVDRKVAENLVELMTSFATNGVPKSTSVPTWPAFKSINGPYLRIKAESEIANNYFDEFQIISKLAYGDDYKPIGH